MKIKIEIIFLRFQNRHFNLVVYFMLLRHNLDPEDKKTDMELWEALETAQLKATVSKLENGLGKDNVINYLSLKVYNKLISRTDLKELT